MQNLIEMLRDTPWWVYLIFAFIIYMGIKATRARIVSIKRLLIIPAILVIMSAHTMLTMSTLTTTMILYGIATIIIGGLIGWQMTKMGNIKVDHQNQLMEIQGSWLTLVIIIVIFATKYYAGYMTAVHPEVAQEPVFVHTLFVISGFILGLLVGRMSHYLYCYKTKPSVHLSKK